MNDISAYYDVVLSFAGEDRSHAEALAHAVAKAGYRVFYDTWEQDSLWGENLYQFMHSIYRDYSRFCVIFVSASYRQKAWTNHELRSAQERAFQDSEAYILPIKIDNTMLPGMPSTTGYLDLRKLPIEAIGELLIKKLQSPDKGIRRDFGTLDASRQMTLITRAAISKNASYLETLCNILENEPDAELRARAAWALDNINDFRSLHVLLRAIADPDWQVRSNAGWALVHLGKGVEADVRVIRLTSPSAEAREMASLVLERIC